MPDSSVRPSVWKVAPGLDMLKEVKPPDKHVIKTYVRDAPLNSVGRIGFLLFLPFIGEAVES